VLRKTLRNNTHKVKYLTRKHKIKKITALFPAGKIEKIDPTQIGRMKKHEFSNFKRSIFSYVV